MSHGVCFESADERGGDEMNANIIPKADTTRRGRDR